MNFTVGNEFDEINVKTFLRHYCDVSARLLSRLKRTENGITVNGRHARSIDILHPGDIVSLSMPSGNNSAEPVDLPVRIMYEDDSIIVFDKPPFMPVHPSHDHQLDTLANAAAFHAIKKGENYPFRAINRLDRDTSGLVLTAKNSYASTFLAKKVSKEYFALCEGEMSGSGVIDIPIRIKPGHTIQREASEDGVRAITHYDVLWHENDHSFLRLRLETGRTHQIRTHLSHVGHPLAGDDMYGGSREIFQRQCLHCGTIELVHPVTHKTLIIRSDPEDWRTTLENYYCHRS